MSTPRQQREQAAAGLEQLSALVRAQSWRSDGSPALPPTQAAVLRLLGQPGPLRAFQIAERLGVSPASLSDSLKALEAKKWIARSPDPADRRASLLRLTRAGQVVSRQLRDPANGLGRLLQGMNEQDIGVLLRATQLLVGQAQRLGMATGTRTCLGCRFFKPYGGSADQPHFCDFIGKAFGDAELRVDCAEQLPADTEQLAENLARFRQLTPP